MQSLPRPTARQVLQNPFHLIAFGFGAGLSPYAPGTLGAGVGLVIFTGLAGLALPIYGLIVGVSFLLGVWVCQRSSRALGVHDHNGIVWDEVVGLWVTMTAAPAGWVWLVVGMVLFRGFDIFKPWPVSWIDRRLGGGLGIMLDDAVAGGYAWLALQIMAAYFT